MLAYELVLRHSWEVSIALLLKQVNQRDHMSIAPQGHVRVNISDKL